MTSVSAGARIRPRVRHLAARALPVTLLAVGLCVGPSVSAQASGAASSLARDSADALATFRDNLAAIHTRDKARYLATYVHTERLVRHSPTALETGYEGWSAITDNAWPDTLIVQDMRVVPLAPGVVYGYYRYIGVPAPGDTLTGVSTRVFVRTPEGMRITVTSSWNDVSPIRKP